jgi:hypothetical protein
LSLQLLAAVCSISVLVFGADAARAAGSRGSSPKLSIPNVQVSHDSYLAHSEPAIAENPKNPKNLIAASKFFTDPTHYQFKIGTFYSMDGGRTWHDSVLLPGFQNYHLTSDVSIAFSSTGVAYVAVLGCDGGVCPGDGNRSGVFVSISKDGGKTFAAPVTVYEDTIGATFSDKPWIAVDQSSGGTAGTIYVAWNLDPIGDTSSCDAEKGNPLIRRKTIEATISGMVVARSTDGGQTFSDPVQVAKFTAQQSYIGAIPAVGPNGQLSVVFSRVNCRNSQVGGIDLVTSTDGGVRFSPPRPVANDVVPLPDHLKNGTFRNVTLPTFAISPTGSMVVAWADMRNGDADILAARSGDDGKTWSKPIRVNDDRLGDGKDQFQPALAVAPNGTFTCAWFDRRRDPKNRLIDEEIAQSRDGGRSFGRNIRVTQKSWDPAIDAPQPEGRSSNTFIGDYQALAVDNRTVHPLWNDTQNRVSQEIRTAFLPVRLFTAK